MPVGSTVSFKADVSSFEGQKAINPSVVWKLKRVRIPDPNEAGGFRDIYEQAEIAKYASITQQGKVTVKAFAKSIHLSATSVENYSVFDEASMEVYQPIKSITLLTESTLVGGGKEVPFQVKSILPADADKTEIDWVSSNPKVVQIRKKGSGVEYDEDPVRASVYQPMEYLAKGAGTATITGKEYYTGKKISFKVTVLRKMKTGDVALKVTSTKVKADALIGNGERLVNVKEAKAGTVFKITPILPGTAVDKSIIFHSEDPSMVTVDGGVLARLLTGEGD